MEMAVQEPEEQGVAMRLWEKFKNESAFPKYTPFMICLASGAVNLVDFSKHVDPDYSFFTAFRNTFQMVVAQIIDKVERKEMQRLSNIVTSTLRDPCFSSNVDFCYFMLGGNLDARFYNSEVEKCIKFLSKTASGIKVAATTTEKMKVAAYTLGAMTPHLRFHNSLSKELPRILLGDPRNKCYQKWIDTYSSEDFEEATLQMEKMLDKLSIPLTPQELEVLEKVYHQALKLQMNVFSARTVTRETVVPLSGVLGESHFIVFASFDLTCTTVESSVTLAELTIATASNLLDLRNRWNVLTKNYNEEYEKCIESMVLSEKVEKFNLEGLCKALEKLSEFKKQANSKVIDSAVLRGLNLEDIKVAGERFMLQDGCIDFFQKIANNAQVHILSNCWCGDFVRSVFSSARGLDRLNVYTNKFSYKESISTGEFVTKLDSPTVKVQLLRDILMDSKCLSVYIGDSVGDLLCLLEANVGIVIGSNSNLRKVGNHFGVSFVPLFAGLVKKQHDHAFNWKGMSGILYTVSSWYEIHAFILGRSTQEFLDLLDFPNMEI